jgi:hypothetical protein
MTTNPYESVKSPAIPSWKTRDVIRFVLGCVATLFGVLLILGALIEVDLLLRYPGLRDPSSGPAYYWPADLFHVVGIFCMVMFLFFALTFGLYWTRKATKKTGQVGQVS